MSAMVEPNTPADILDYANYRYNRGLGMSHDRIARVLSLQMCQRHRYKFRFERDYIHGQHDVSGRLIDAEAIFIKSCPSIVESASAFEDRYQARRGSPGVRFTGD